MTQPTDLISPNVRNPQPSRTGASLHRPHKSLLGPNPARYSSFVPQSNIEDQLAYEIQKEKNKISRFLVIKENQSKSIADKEKVIEQRLAAARKRSLDYEKIKRGEEKIRRSYIHEARSQA